MSRKNTESGLTRRGFIALTGGVGAGLLVDPLGAPVEGQAALPSAIPTAPMRLMPVAQGRQLTLARLAASPLPELRPLMARIPITPIARARATAVVAAARKAARSKRPVAVQTRLALFDTKIKSASPSIQAALARKPQRTPDTIARRWTDAALPGLAPHKTTVFVLQTKPTTLAGVEAHVLKALRLPAGQSLAAAGITVEPLFRKQHLDTLFVMRLGVTRKKIGRDVHNFAYAVRKLTGFASVIPERHLTLLQGPGPTVDPSTVAPSDIQWPINQMRVREAWQVPITSPDGRARGRGAVVGHPDSGWRSHSQFDESQIDKNRAANTVESQIVVGAGAAVHGVPAQDPNFCVDHGTGTGGLIVSADDTRLGNDSGFKPAKKGDTTTKKLNVCGVAPEAQIIPIKCVADDDLLGVIRISDVALARAIEYATDCGVDVISISMGGLAHPAIETAVARAIRNNVIICAAAGQSYGAVNALSPNDTVIEPAAFPDVIAVAGSTARRKPWKDSHYGPNVDITTPAHGVWCACFADKTGAEIIRCAEGTSFSAALTSATAALWVSHWGRTTLRRRYPDKPLAWVFRHVLQNAAVRPAGWDTRRWGPGILDAEAVLRFPLPNPSDVQAPPATTTNTVTVIGDMVRDFDDVLAMLEDLAQDSAELARRLASAGWALARGAAESTLGWLGDQYAAASALADQAVGETKKKAEDVLAALGKAIGDVADAATQAAEDGAEATEDAATTVAGVVESTANAVGEAATDVWNWLTGN